MTEWMGPVFFPESIRQRAKDHEEGNTWAHHLAYDNASNSPAHYHLPALVDCDKVCIDPTNEWWERYRGESQNFRRKNTKRGSLFGWLVKDAEGQLHPGPMLKQYEEEEGPGLSA